MAITNVIDPIPEAPQRSNPDDFYDKADIFLKRLETLDDDLNEWADQCNTTAQQVNEDAQVADEARTVCEAIGASNGYKGEWDSNTTYAQGDVVSYSGLLWLSKQGNNQGNTPQEGSAWWLKVQRTFDCIYVTGTVDAGVSAGDPVYFDSRAGVWKKACYLTPQGIFDGSKIVLSGKVNCFTGLIPGQYYYNNNGEITRVKDSTHSDIVGLAISETSLVANIVPSTAKNPFISKGKVFVNTYLEIQNYGRQPVFIDRLLGNYVLGRVKYSPDYNYYGPTVFEIKDNYLLPAGKYSTLNLNCSSACLIDHPSLGKCVIMLSDDANDNRPYRLTVNGNNIFYRYLYLNNTGQWQKIRANNGNIYLIGRLYDGTNYYPAVMRIDYDLVYQNDKYFGVGYNNSNNCFYGAKISVSGELVCVGFVNVSGQWKLLLTKFSEDLYSATSVYIDFDNTVSVYADVAIGADGSIYAVWCVNDGSAYVTYLAKIANDLSSVHTQKFLCLNAGSFCFPYSLNFGHDGNLYLVGSASDGAQSWGIVVKLDTSLNVLNVEGFSQDVSYRTENIAFIGNVTFLLSGSMLVLKQHDNTSGSLFSVRNGYEWKALSIQEVVTSYSLVSYSPTINSSGLRSTGYGSYALKSIFDFYFDEDYWE